ERVYQLWYPICGLTALQLQAGLDGFLAIVKYRLVKRGVFTSAARRQPDGGPVAAAPAAAGDRGGARVPRGLSAVH
ncbi:MAG: dihydrodipicolinate synthase family protein, partial [Planctomyces sp.]